jgi:hypothetical protein
VAGQQPPKISVSDLDNIDRLLDQVPVHRDTSVSKLKAVAILAPKLHAMRAKGYTWPAIAAWLMEHGLTITATALQGYLRRVAPADRSERRRAARRRHAQVMDGDAIRQPPPGAAPVPAVATQREVQETPAAAASGRQAVERPAEPSVRRSAFVVRPDTLRERPATPSFFSS